MVNYVALGGRITQTHRQYNVKLQNEEVETLVTHDPTMVESWITETLSKNECRLHRLIVGLDIEWSPKFIMGCDHSVAVLQLCVGRSCLIFQIHRSEGIPQKLRSFLGNWDYIFVGAGIKNDADKLRDDYQLRVAHMIDLGLWAAQQLGKEELCAAGLKLLVKEVIGIEMNKPKSVTCSKWDSHVLTEKQVAYACADAYYSFEIGRRLSAWYCFLLPLSR